MDTEVEWSSKLPIGEWVIAFLPAWGSESVSDPSPRTKLYNCVAWAAGENDRWWSHGLVPEHFWPRSVPRRSSVDAYAEALCSIGFERCDLETALDPKYEKIALFGNSGLHGHFAHACRQLADGHWTSKFGDLEDVRHPLAALSGGLYGELVLCLRRPAR